MLKPAYSMETGAKFQGKLLSSLRGSDFTPQRFK